MSEKIIRINIMVITDDTFEWTERLMEDLPFAKTVKDKHTVTIRTKNFHFVIKNSFSVMCSAYKAQLIIVDKQISEAEQRRLDSSFCKNITYTKKYIKKLA